MAVVKSFMELAELFGINPKAKQNRGKKNNKKNGKGKAEKKAKPRICKACGSELRPIAGTNAWVCDGLKTVKNEETGENEKVPCNNRILSRRINPERKTA